MKRSVFLGLVATGILLLALFASCSPNVQPTPTVAPPSPTKAPVTTTTSPSTSPEDAAWAKIVDAAKKEGELTIYTNSLRADVGTAVSDAIEQKYGIRLNLVVGRGSAFIERLKTEKRMGTLVGDLGDHSPINAKFLEQEGLTTGIADEVPTLREKDPWVADIFANDPKDKNIITFYFATYAPYVNTNLVKPGQEPKSWKDFLDPKWKSKIVSLDPNVTAGLYEFTIPLMREKLIDENLVKDLYKQDMMLTKSYPDEAAALSRGDRAISLSSIDRDYGGFVAQGAPIKALAMSEGTVMGSTSLVVYKGGPHPNAARVFVNWFMSKEGQTVYDKAMSIASVRKDSPNFLPQGARIAATRLIVQTTDDLDLATKYFQDHYANKLWGR